MNIPEHSVQPATPAATTPHLNEDGPSLVTTMFCYGDYVITPGGPGKLTVAGTHSSYVRYARGEYLQFGDWYANTQLELDPCHAQPAV